MTAQTSLYGRLTVEPQPHQTRTGSAMTTAKLAVELTIITLRLADSDAKTAHKTGSVIPDDRIYIPL